MNRLSPNTGSENRKASSTLGKQFMMDLEHRNAENLINATPSLCLITIAKKFHQKHNAYMNRKRMLIAFIPLLQDYQSNTLQLQGEFDFGVT